MRFRHLILAIALCGCLTACGPKPPASTPESTSASNPDTSTSVPASTPGDTSVPVSTPTDSVTLSPVKCTYRVPTGELGTFYAVTSNGKSQEFTSNVVIYSSDEYALTVDQKALPAGTGNDFRTMPDNVYALRTFLTGEYNIEIVNTNVVSSDEAVFEIKEVIDDYEYAGRMGVSLINRTQLFVYKVLWDPQRLSEDTQHELAKMVSDTFSRRVFEAGSTDTSVDNPNEGISQVYIPLPNSEYDIVVPGSAYIRNIDGTNNQYDIWYGKTISASVQRFDTSQVDLSITEHNLELVDYQKALIPTSGNYENFKITSAPSEFMEVKDGFSKKLSYVWGGESKTYVDMYLFADSKGFTTVTVKSFEPIPGNFTSESMKFILDSDRKTNGELNTIPQALISTSTPEDAVYPIHLETSAFNHLRNVSEEYMETNFGETNVSGSFMVKQLYYKDIFQNVLLPFTASMDAAEGSVESASSSWVPYGDELEDAMQVSISYSLFSADPNSVDTEEGKTPTDMDTYGFSKALDSVAGEYFSEMEANNVYFSTDSENVTSSVYQRQFSYRCNDAVTNKSYTKNVAVFIKNMGDDKYQENSRNYFAAVMVWGSRAPSNQVSNFQQAFESVVKQVQ